MSAQLNDVLYAERLGIAGKIKVDDIVEYSRKSVDQHNDVNLQSLTALDGDTAVFVGGVLVRKPRPLIIEKSSWQRTTNDIDTPILDGTVANTNIAIALTTVFEEIGLWKPIISFLCAVNSTGANFEAYCTVDGNTLVSANPISSIVAAIESKDAAGQHPDFPGNATGAGTDNIKPVTLVCNTIDITQLNNEILLVYGCETNAIIASIAEITIQFERVYNVTTIN